MCQTEAELCLGSEVFAVAELAEDLLGAGRVAALRRVERPLAVQAGEARLVEGLGREQIGRLGSAAQRLVHVKVCH